MKMINKVTLHLCVYSGGVTCFSYQGFYLADTSVINTFPVF